MNFAENILQISKDCHTNSEIYSRMIEAVYYSLQNEIADRARKSGVLCGELFIPQHINGYIVTRLFDQVGHRKTDLFEIGRYDDATYAKFMPFFTTKQVMSRCIFTLSSTGKRVTDDLYQLFNADGVNVWYDYIRKEKYMPGIVQNGLLVLHYEI